MPRHDGKNILSSDVPRDLAVQVRGVARANGTTVSAIIRRALEEWLEKR